MVFEIEIPGNVDIKVRVGMLLIQISRTHNNYFSQIRSQLVFPLFTYHFHKEYYLVSIFLQLNET